MGGGSSGGRGGSGAAVEAGLGVVKAIYSFKGSHNDEVSISPGIIEIIEIKIPPF